MIGIIGVFLKEKSDLRVYKPEESLCRVFGCERRPRKTYLELLPNDFILRAYWQEDESDIEENCKPEEALRFDLPSPYLSRDDIGNLMDLVKANCLIICKGRSYTHKGITYSHKAIEAMANIERMLRMFPSQRYFKHQDTVFHRMA